MIVFKLNQIQLTIHKAQILSNLLSKAAKFIKIHKELLAIKQYETLMQSIFRNK